MSQDGRPRRIVHYPRSTQFSDVKVSPLWHQWLRYTRADPPTLQEQTLEQARQERMRLLAAEADARWEAKPRIGVEAGLPPHVTGDQLKGMAERTGREWAAIPVAGGVGGSVGTMGKVSGGGSRAGDAGGSQSGGSSSTWAQEKE